MMEINLFIVYMLHAVMMYYLLMIGMKGLDISREKRYQESNWLVKLSRLRFYVYIPFKWFMYQFTTPFIITDDMTGDKEVIGGKLLWRILKGDAQGDMQWYYTMDEVKAEFKTMDDIYADEADYWRGND
jgi:hypothetical protein